MNGKKKTPDDSKQKIVRITEEELVALIRREIKQDRVERAGCTIPNDPIGIVAW